MKQHNGEIIPNRSDTRGKFVKQRTEIKEINYILQLQYFLIDIQLRD